jgi:hypothetical protein
MKLKEVIEKYSGSPRELTVRTFVESGETPETFVLFEGDAAALRFIGEAILAFADSNVSCNWDIHPRGAGSVYFGKDSTVGVYLHKSAL